MSSFGQQSNPIPDVDVQVPSEVQGLFSTGLGWIGGGGLVLLAGAAMIGAIMWGVGSMSERPDSAARGKRTMIFSLAAAGLLAVIAGLVWVVYSSVAG